jgi:UDP-2,3-diacylglucosamine pyrophosphatase LpxH
MNISGKRKLDFAVISDVHLGTYGCHAHELNRYLKSIQPKILVINGDFIDMWQLSRSYFPDDHIKVLRRVLKLMADGTEVYYITGNHDEFLRKFAQTQMGHFHLVNKLILQHQGEYHWFFHGDVFDMTMKHAKWLAMLGGKGYDYLIIFNRLVNHILERLGRPRISLSKKVKDSIKRAAKHISDFETSAATFAARQGFKYVVCGHIHEPVIKDITTEYGTVRYLNSGDWIENLSSLEFANGAWNLVYYKDLQLEDDHDKDDEKDWTPLLLDAG